METKIAIKGDKERGLEVIIALEELGGVNNNRRMGTNDDVYYYLLNNKTISYIHDNDEDIPKYSYNFNFYTLDEYIKSFGPLKHSQQEIEQLYRLNKECDTFYTSLDKINWMCVSMDGRLSEDVIRYFQDKVDWKCISQYQVLSEAFIREFQDKVDWIYISACQTLSENFIIEFQDKVNWEEISENQELSSEFINEFKDKLDMDIIKEKQKQMLKEIYNQFSLVYELDDSDDYFEEFKQLFNIK